MASKKVKTALISVFYKDGLAPIVEKLHAEGVQLLSTGGTQKFIEELGIPVQAVEDLTGFPSIFGGRVKTLHPKIFGGILHQRGLDADVADAKAREIPEIDLVIVDLYPFEDTVANTEDESQIIEKIDIGGISLIRAAAKNYKDVMILSSRKQYQEFLSILEESGANTSLEQRKRFAAMAFATSSHYDSAIFNYFNEDVELDELRVSVSGAKTLRYGENPHQRGKFYGDLSSLFNQLHGKELSYNNLLDIDAAVALMSEFDDCTFAILKHNNACGIASRPTVKEAYLAALEADNISAFGGILITNKPVDLAAAEEINKLFCEVLIAPAYDSDAFELLKSKKNRVILEHCPHQPKGGMLRTSLNGILWQDRDEKTEDISDLSPATKLQPSDSEKEDLIFAAKLAKHTKSNTIVLAKNKQLLASGVGQTSRVDALKQAIEKANAFGLSLEGAVMASDAFFPFPDCVEIAGNAGVKSVIQPGGSIKDQLSIDYCNEHDIAMVFTGTRHFKH